MSQDLLNQEMKDQLKKVLSAMKDEVNIILFTKEDSEASKITKKLLLELNNINNLIKVEAFDILTNPKLVEQYKVLGGPSYVILTHDKKDTRGVFYGVPSGHEINTLITNIMDVSDPARIQAGDAYEQVKKIDKETNIKVFVTVSCPHCPGAAINALRLAQLNDNITAEVFEANSFPEVATQYEVSSVPTIIINNNLESAIIGNQPIEDIIKAINEA